MKTKNSFAILRKILFLIMALSVIFACKKDDNTPPAPVNPIVGTYTFIASTFNDPITVIVNGDTNHYVAGDDAYLFVGGGLLGAAPCDNADNAALDLRANFTSFYVCLGESNEAQQGTWSINEENTILKLNISNPANFPVFITNLDLTDNKLTGNIPSLPMPYDTSIPVGDPLPGGGFNFQAANVTVEFLKVE
ncbi:MAG: hypothetical protein HQ565_00670 [Bacteroidetes bacterium]|nr:hypothetical protein [Bacteroidota bacterium]